MSIGQNLAAFKSALPQGVTLVAVSKTKPASMLQEAYSAGQRDFGENYVQELVDKQPQLPNDINWHFIGHLQSNKVKYIAPFVHLIHGVDSFKLLQEINKQALKQNRVINCLLQVYIAQEETKFGLDAVEIQDWLASGASAPLNNICIAGLMGMASNTDNEKQVSAEFGQLAQLYQHIKAGTYPNVNMQYLSCGMSSDYRLALEAGSNMLRIGSAIFGHR